MTGVRRVLFRSEDAHRIAAAADGRDDRVGLPARVLGHLGQAFVADHALEVADHHRVGVGPRHRADDVDGVLDVRDPVAQDRTSGASGKSVDPGGPRTLHTTNTAPPPATVSFTTTIPYDTSLLTPS